MNNVTFDSKSKLSAYAVKLKKKLASKYDIHLKLTKVQHMLAEIDGFRGFDSVPDDDTEKAKGFRLHLNANASSGIFFDAFSDDEHKNTGILSVSDVLERYSDIEISTLNAISSLIESGNSSLEEAYTQLNIPHLNAEKIQWIPALTALSCFSSGYEFKDCSQKIELLIEQVTNINNLIEYKQGQGLILAKALLFSIFKPNQSELIMLIKSTVRDYPVMWSSWFKCNIHSISIPFFPDAGDIIEYSRESLIVGYPYWFRDLMGHASNHIAKAYFSNEAQAYFYDNIDAFFLGRSEVEPLHLPLDVLHAHKASLETTYKHTHCFIDRNNLIVR